MSQGDQAIYDLLFLLENIHNRFSIVGNAYQLQQSYNTGCFACWTRKNAYPLFQSCFPGDEITQPVSNCYPHSDPDPNMDSFAHQNANRDTFYENHPISSKLDLQSDVHQWQL